MKPKSALLGLLVVLTTQVDAFQLPFTIPFLSGGPLAQNPIATAFLPATTPPNRIAIIGAGAGGSSAAFWIAKAKERFGLDVEVDVYEKSGYIGGRSTVVWPYDDHELESVELGASIFIEANKNLWRATNEFGLKRIDFGDDNDAMGLWDGSQFVLTTSGGSFYNGWWDTFKILWRYGIQAPTRTKTIVKAMVDKFVTLYDPDAPRFANLTALAEALHWTPIIAQTTAEYLDTQGVNRRWTRELIDAATRVNYGQNVDSIHALEGLCSLAPQGASSVRGGNFQIFEEFLKRSNASVHLNTAVTAVAHDEATGYWRVSTAGTWQMQVYRAVILAAPLHSTGIKFSPESLTETVPEQPYVRLHVTLLSTSARTPRAEYFGLKGDQIPTEVLTTYNAVREWTGEEPEFNSLTYHGKIQKASGEKWEGKEGEEWVVKIFSKQKIEDEWLEKVFGKVGWVSRKEWDAYPVLPPTISFPPVKLARGLYYVNSFEPFISTMETETISARNIVDLLLQEEFNAAICPSKTNEGNDEIDTVAAKSDKDFVLGWDC